MILPADYAAWAGAGVVLCILLLVFHRPLAFLLRLLLRSSLGLAALALFAQISPIAGITLGVNIVNALVLGLLGVPGFGLLLMLQWVLK